MPESITLLSFQLKMSALYCRAARKEAEEDLSLGAEEHEEMAHFLSGY